MLSVHGYYDGKVVHPEEPVKAPKNSKVILTFLETDNGETFPQTELKDVAGCLPYKGPSKSIEEMEEGIGRGITEENS